MKKSNQLTIGILAHVDAGKTTLSESMLYLNGSIKRLGRVDHGDAFLDMHQIERKRGITVFSKEAQLSLGEYKITLLDTPGHVDFSAEMERTLQVLDYAILVINGSDGIQGHLLTLWKLLNEYQVPVFLFVNKMDLPLASKPQLIEQIQNRLDEFCIDMTCVEHQLEKIALADDDVLNSYLSTGTVTTAQIQQLILHRKLFPCYFGSALKNQGVDTFLSSLTQYILPKEYPEDFAARVYKITRDQQGNRLTHLKITGGALNVREVLSEKVNQIRIYSGEQFTTVNRVEAGAICAVTGLTQTYSGQPLGNELDEKPPVLDAVLTYRMIFPKDTDVYSAYLNICQLADEIPELHLTWNETQREIHVQIMGEIQKEMITSLIFDRYNLSIDFDEGIINYKETIADPVEGIGHFEPLRHYAEVHLLMEPLPLGSGIVLETNCSRDGLEQHWQNLVLSHLAEKQHIGVLTGSPITDMRITLVSGRGHQKHTEGGDFRQATYRAIRQGLRKAKSILLEPVYQFTIEVPTDHMGKAMSDIQRMHGKVNPPETIDDMTILTGTAPVETMNGYQKELLSYTKGKGKIFYTFSGYAPCHRSEEVILSRGYDPERDLDHPSSSIFCHQGAGSIVPWDQVEKHMHLESYFAKINKSNDQLPRHSAQSIHYNDKDLEEIFLRTYGQSKRDKNPLRKASKVITPKQKGNLSGSKPSALNNADAEEILLIDGYNVIFGWDELKELSTLNLEASRDKLIERLMDYHGYTGERIIVVFDAYKQPGNRGTMENHHGVEVIYTKEDETADQFIEKTVVNYSKQYRITVATSDGLEQIMVFGQGALRMPIRELKERIESVTALMRKKYLE
ncbi:ribosomal protection tetracycline resistance protein [Clostridiales Family XIII bacterium PM5-7]